MTYRASKPYLWYKKQILHSLWLRIIIESYLEVLINIFVHLTHVIFKLLFANMIIQLKWGGASDGFSSFLAIAACVLYGMFPFFVVKFLVQNFKLLETSEIKDYWSSLYEPMKQYSLPMLIYLPLFLFRRLIFSFSTVILTNWPVLQVNLLFL